MNFKDDYGVFVCPHVFAQSAPILFSVRDFDGSWQFLCGDDDCIESSKPKLVHVGKLAKIDPTIHQLTSMGIGTYAERFSSIADWTFGKLED
ncbi:DUF2185 domain-containing protein [Alteromonas sp. McT4-15]|uniref:DUF2185 domain-containing protein n=1 Tax=Alteromonas sp. McT4-15 TaxID=2881256 RepID=UPI001CF887BC|nr:DUF2185 domain-containing protein [Alteromonas sp. McT4-15]MCB4438681.1 DUF2185 domain-containing protein [Alteromonas sp. McT4-15]